MHPMRWKRIVFVAVLFLLWFTSSVAAQRTGGISGTVLTEDGYPVTDAHVRAEVMDGEKIVTGLIAQTDEHGRFTFTGLALGKYRLSAEKQESGYLSTLPDIFNSRPEITTNLTDSAPTFNAVIRFEPKAGVISGWVRDAATGRPIRAHLSLAPFSGRGGWSTTGTDGRFEFRLLVPSDIEVRFGACSEGYRRWVYAEPSQRSHAAPLKLKPDFEVRIEIRLEPSTDPADANCWSGDY
jgi:hypothetical protein